MLIYLILIAVGFYLSKWLGAIAFPLIYFFMTNRGKIEQFKTRYKNLEQDYPKLLFQLMGYSAKLDGAVLPAHIKFAEQTMAGFTSRMSKKQMQSWFNQGKRLNKTKARQLVIQANQNYMTRGDIRRSLLEVVYLTIVSGRGYTAVNREFLHDSAQLLSFQPNIIIDLESQYQQQNKMGGAIQSEADLRLAYQRLNVKQNSSVNDIKRARKKLINQNHPDKLTNASAENKARANEIVNDINKAYQQIKDYKGFK